MPRTLHHIGGGAEAAQFKLERVSGKLLETVRDHSREFILRWSEDMNGWGPVVMKIDDNPVDQPWLKSAWLIVWNRSHPQMQALLKKSDSYNPHKILNQHQRWMMNVLEIAIHPI